ncbi:hypothetical protein B0H16DRAFT_1781716 [Mycena metata]|uniref:Uncharacterized protein n=1 Tax=Mycena metata TaxID=1033252 RepID=A0AAD7HQ29_9AGAR|nr:hypothetical protein B0H16DRAFT_1781716 [Mycena metata]
MNEMAYRWCAVSNTGISNEVELGRDARRFEFWSAKGTRWGYPARKKRDEQPGRRARHRPHPGGLRARLLFKWQWHRHPNAAIYAPRRATHPAAWALVVRLLSHPDPNVQFFGAHTAHANIARGELSSLSAEEQMGLREALVGLAGVQGRTRVVRRKVYSAVVALAIRSVGEGGSAGWEGWLEGTVSALAGAGAPSAHIHEFLAGAGFLPQPRNPSAPQRLSVLASAVSGQDSSGGGMGRGAPRRRLLIATTMPTGTSTQSSSGFAAQFGTSSSSARPQIPSDARTRDAAAHPHHHGPGRRAPPSTSNSQAQSTTSAFSSTTSTSSSAFATSTVFGSNAQNGLGLDTAHLHPGAQNPGADSNNDNNEDAADEDDDEDYAQTGADDGIPPGGPLAFWFAL